MKKLLFIFAFLLCSMTYSQNNKGEMMLSVALSPYPTITNNQDDFGALALASFEFFISNKGVPLWEFFHFK